MTSAILKPKLNMEMDNKSAERSQESSKVDDIMVQKSQTDQVQLKGPADAECKMEIFQEIPGSLALGGKEESMAPNKDEDKTKISNPTLSSKTLNIDCLELALPPELALQLNEIFGPVGIDSGSLTVEDCVVNIDLNLAKTIHEQWKASVMKRQRNEDELYMLLMEDPTLFEQLHLDDSDKIFSQCTDDKLQKKKATMASCTPTDTQFENSATSEVFPFMDHWNAQTQKVSLREIMLEEVAFQEKQDLKRVPFMARKDCAA
uniref:DUF7818 domain-containing protein n=1 Tax=Sphenodon punctatus TaxID=8508 RepID=A0A8D0GKG1_SPHPU